MRQGIKKITQVLFLLVGLYSFGQEKMPVNRSKCLLEDTEIKQRVSLKFFVENIYKNSSDFNHGRKPAIKDGDYDVVVIKNSKEPYNKYLKTKDLENIYVEDIKEITFQKKKDLLYGHFGDLFGIVIIELKNKN